MKPAEISSQSGKKPMFRHQFHGGARALAQPHVKTEAAGGGGRKARLYKRLVVRTQSPMRLMASRNRVISAQPTAGIWSRFHLKRRRTHFMWAYLAGQNVCARSWIGRHHGLIGIGFGAMSVDSHQGFARTMGLRNRHLNCKAS